MKIDLSVEAGFGKRPLLKKDYQVVGHQLTCRGINKKIDLLAEAGFGKRPLLKKD